MRYRELSEPETTRITSQATCALGYLAAGAGIAYFFDPQLGRRRRSLVLDKFRRTFNRTGVALRKTAEYSGDRARGMMAEARGRLTDDQPSDEVLSERVRSAMGRAVSHPSSIEVSACDGVVCLWGPVLADEVDGLLRTVWGVRGVRMIENQLEEHATAADVPGLQGGIRRRGRRGGVAQENWSPSTRLLTSLTGSTVALYGLFRRDIAGLILFASGAGIALRGLTNLPVKRLTGIGAGRRAIDIQKTININAPQDVVFGFFANYRNFPHFMSNVREVRDHASGRSHWTVAGPGGVPVEWDADLTDYVPNRLIAWKSVEGAAVENAGIIRFEPNADGSTRVDIKLSYNPPGGALGHGLAKIFGSDPKSEMDSDLARVKTLLETGNPPADAAQPIAASAPTAL